MTIPVLPVYKAVAALIEEATGKPVGLGKLAMKRDGNDKPTRDPDLPCTALYVHPGSTSGPGWGDADADAELKFRARAVGKSADQVEWLLDRIRDAWVGRTDLGAHTTDFAVDGLSTMLRYVDSESPIDPEKDEVFSRSIVLCAALTPAASPP